MPCGLYDLWTQRVPRRRTTIRRTRELGERGASQWRDELVASGGGAECDCERADSVGLWACAGAPREVPLTPERTAWRRMQLRTERSECRLFADV